MSPANLIYNNVPETTEPLKVKVDSENTVYTDEHIISNYVYRNSKAIRDVNVPKVG
ncbi:hypothetical protein K502DRAFT_350779 [Neoconidiobolus thromboides FSU 785]|nr:hypothetical protein K502DRAFT_350779 [Neoconidiobolus thromboides FSU 785]